MYEEDERKKSRFRSLRIIIGYMHVVSALFVGNGNWGAGWGSNLGGTVGGSAFERKKVGGNIISPSLTSWTA